MEADRALASANLDGLFISTHHGRLLRCYAECEKGAAGLRQTGSKRPPQTRGTTSNANLQNTVLEQVFD
jgi:hypothetical protein